MPRATGRARCGRETAADWGPNNAAAEGSDAADAAIVTILGAESRRSEAQLALGTLGMRTIHFTTGDRLAGQLAALGVAA